MNGIDQALQAGNESVVVNSDFATPMASGFFRRGHLDCDQPGAALHACKVIGDAIPGDETFVVRGARCHRRHDDPVLDFDRSDPRRGEKDVHLINCRVRKIVCAMPTLRLLKGGGEQPARYRPHNTGISPPSRSIVAPCSQLAREETANTTRLPTSSTVPTRIGLLNSRNNCSRIFCSVAPVRSISALIRRRVRSVSTMLGWMQFTRTPSVLPRSARHLLKAATAALTELPMVNSAVGLRPPVPPIEMSAPPRSANNGQAARASRTWAKNFNA